MLIVTMLYNIQIQLVQIRSEIQKAKLELWFQLKRQPSEDEIIEKVRISPERYHEVTRASKPVLSLHSRHKTTQEEFIGGVADADGGDDRRQSALLRLALDDVVSSHYTLSQIFYSCDCLSSIESGSPCSAECSKVQNPSLLLRISLSQTLLFP